MINFDKKNGFTLAEAMIFLLVAAMLMAATMPILTRRHLKPAKKVPHGKWACKYVNGVMKHATAGNSSAKLPPDDEWVTGCTFPELPASVKYIMVRVIGAGAAGSAAREAFAGQKALRRSEKAPEHRHRVYLRPQPLLPR